MVENNCLREELCVMGRYRSAAFTRTSLTSYLLKLILQRRCTYVSAKSFNLYVLLRRKPLSLSLLYRHHCHYDSRVWLALASLNVRWHYAMPGGVKDQRYFGCTE